MGKKRKGPTLDVELREKLDQIMREIETAQHRKDPLEAILKKTSAYLKQEPSLTIPLIETLARIPNPETAQLLFGLMADAKEKKIIKSIKSTIYKLRQKGVRWKEKPSGDRPILRPPKPAEPLGYLSPIDSTGSRIIVVARPVPLKGLFVVFSVTNDLEGIQQFSPRQFNKKGFAEFFKSSLSSADFPVVETPGAYCLYLLKEASSITQSLSKPLPQGYHDTDNEFKDIKWDDPTPIIYQYIKEDEVRDRPHYLKESGNLHKIMPFSTWHLSDIEIQKYASSITQAQESRILLTPDQKKARLNSIYMDALKELFPEDKKLLWKRRLEEMAYILLKTGKEQEARAALSAAIDLKNPFSPIDPNPFIWNLMLKSIYYLIDGDHEKKEEEKKTSLIVTP